MTLISLLLAIILLAAYSLVETAAPAPTAAESRGFFASQVAPLFASYVPPDVLHVEDLPRTGCSTSLLNKEHLDTLLAAVPEPQRKVLIQLLDTSSGIWEAQLYYGDHGSGICLPARNALVLLPGNIFAIMEAAIARSTQ